MACSLGSVALETGDDIGRHPLYVPPKCIDAVSLLLRLGEASAGLAHLVVGAGPRSRVPDGVVASIAPGAQAIEIGNQPDIRVREARELRDAIIRVPCQWPERRVDGRDVHYEEMGQIGGDVAIGLCGAYRIYAGRAVVGHVVVTVIAQFLVLGLVVLF